MLLLLNYSVASLLVISFLVRTKWGLRKENRRKIKLEESEVDLTINKFILNFAVVLNYEEQAGSENEVRCIKFS